MFQRFELGTVITLIADGRSPFQESRPTFYFGDLEKLGHKNIVQYTPVVVLKNPEKKAPSVVAKTVAKIKS